MSELKDRRYVRKLPDAYKKTVESNNNKLLQIDEAAVDNLYTDISEVVSVLDLDNANGKILDDYGEMLGVYRGELNDRQYRAVIKANIAANISKSDYMSVMRGLDYIFGKGIMSISEVADSIATVRLADTTYENLRETGLNADQIKELTKKLIAIGVQIEASNFWGTFEFGDILTLSSNTLSGKTVSIPDDESTFTELESITLYGKSTQDGTPSPDNPVEIVSVGDSGSVEVQTCGKNLFPWNDYTEAPIGNWGLSTGCHVYVSSDEIKVEVGPDTAGAGGGAMVFGGNYRQVVAPHYGKTLTISYELKADDEITVRHGWEKAGIYVDSAVSTTWQKFSCSRVYKNECNICWKTINQPETNLYIRNIQIEIGDTATAYEPYKSTAANITSALPLCGIPVSEGGNYTDSTGQQWICDELVYNADGSGKVIKRTAQVTLDGSDDEVWIVNQNENYKNDVICLIHLDNTLSEKMNTSMVTLVCNLTKNFVINYYKDIEGAYFSWGGNFCLRTKSSIVGNTANDVKIWLQENPLTSIYPIAEPQEIPLSAAEMTALRELQTYSGVTNISNSGGADMTVSYDIKGMEYDEAKGWGNIEQTIGGFFGTVVKGITDVRTRKPLIYVKPPNTRIVYNKPAEITLSSKTYGAKIYYTIDGTDPTDKSTLYTEPFILYSGDYTGVNKTVKAIAYSDDLAPSSISEKVITWKPALIGTFEFSSITPEYDANKGFGNIQQTIGGYVGDVIDNIQWEE